MKIIAIESTCDETSVAYLENKQVLSCLTWSQITYHQQFGGVVPQIASKLHANKLPILLDQTIKEVKINWKEVDLIAYASHPGLIGCLKMGESIAKTLSTFYRIPLLGVNHLHAHLYATNIDQEIIFPALGLVVSGGHTQMFYMPKALVFEKIGNTLDDAAGEVLDKIGRSLNLGYPAGSKIEQLANKQGKKTYHFGIYDDGDNLNFSFSGLKSNAINLIAKEGLENLDINSFAYHLQKTIFSVIKKKIILALKQYPSKCIVLGGGVVANKTLRKTISQLSVPVLYPQKEYCTDNGAMVGILASYQSESKRKKPY